MPRTITWAAVLAVLAAAVLAGFGCASEPKTSDENLAEVQIDYKQLSAQLADKNSHTVVVDVRSSAEYAQGHIPGAINISLPDIRPNDPRLAEAQHIVVYAAGPLDLLSPAGAKQMMHMGYQNVEEFRGGLDMWTTEGGKVVH